MRRQLFSVATPEQAEASSVLFDVLREKAGQTVADLVEAMARRALALDKPHLRINVSQVNTRVVRWLDAGKVSRRHAKGWNDDGRAGRIPFAYSARATAVVTVPDFVSQRAQYEACRAMFELLREQGPLTRGELVSHCGFTGAQTVISIRLAAWKRRELVDYSGPYRSVRWFVRDGAVYPPYDDFIAGQDARRRNPSASMGRVALWLKPLVPKRVVKRRPSFRATSQGAAP